MICRICDNKLLKDELCSGFICSNCKSLFDENNFFYGIEIEKNSFIINNKSHFSDNKYPCILHSFELYCNKYCKDDYFIDMKEIKIEEITINNELENYNILKKIIENLCFI